MGGGRKNKRSKKNKKAAARAAPPTTDASAAAADVALAVDAVVATGQQADAGTTATTRQSTSQDHAAVDELVAQSHAVEDPATQPTADSAVSNNAVELAPASEAGEAREAALATETAAALEHAPEAADAPGGVAEGAAAEGGAAAAAVYSVETDTQVSTELTEGAEGEQPSDTNAEELALATSSAEELADARGDTDAAVAGPYGEINVAQEQEATELCDGLEDPSDTQNATEEGAGDAKGGATGNALPVDDTVNLDDTTTLSAAAVTHDMAGEQTEDVFQPAEDVLPMKAGDADEEEALFAALEAEMTARGVRRASGAHVPPLEGDNEITTLLRHVEAEAETRARAAILPVADADANAPLNDSDDASGHSHSFLSRAAVDDAELDRAMAAVLADEALFQGIDVDMAEGDVAHDRLIEEDDAVLKAAAGVVSATATDLGSGDGEQSDTLIHSQPSVSAVAAVVQAPDGLSDVNDDDRTDDVAGDAADSEPSATEGDATVQQPAAHVSVDDTAARRRVSQTLADTMVHSALHAAADIVGSMSQSQRTPELDADVVADATGNKDSAGPSAARGSTASFTLSAVSAQDFPLPLASSAPLDMARRLGTTVALAEVDVAPDGETMGDVAAARDAALSAAAAAQAECAAARAQLCEVRAELAVARAAQESATAASVAELEQVRGALSATAAAQAATEAALRDAEEKRAAVETQVPLLQTQLAAAHEAAACAAREAKQAASRHEAEWDDRLRAAADAHDATVTGLQRDHRRALANLQRELTDKTAAMEDLEASHASTVAGLNAKVQLWVAAAQQANTDGKAEVLEQTTQLNDAKALITQLKVQVADLKPLAARTHEAEAMAERMTTAAASLEVEVQRVRLNAQMAQDRATEAVATREAQDERENELRSTIASLEHDIAQEKLEHTRARLKVEEVCKVNDELLGRVRAEQEGTKLAQLALAEHKASVQAVDTDLRQQVDGLRVLLEEARAEQHRAERESVEARERALAQVHEAEAMRRMAEAELRAIRGLGSAAAADRETNYSATADAREALLTAQRENARALSILQHDLDEAHAALNAARREAAAAGEARETAEARAADLAAELAKLTAGSGSEGAEGSDAVTATPPDSRSELLQLRLAKRLHGAEVERFEAKQVDLQSRVAALVAQLTDVQDARNRLMAEAMDTDRLRRDAVVAQQRAQLLEAELTQTRERLSKEVAQRARAETGLASATIDLKHAEARASEAGRQRDKLQQEQETLAAARTGIGGIEWFDPTRASSSSSGNGTGAGNAAMGAYSSLLRPEKPFEFGSLVSAPYSYGDMSHTDNNVSTGGRSVTDYMQDARLAEQRAKAAEKRESALVAQLKAMEHEAAGVSARSSQAAGVVSLNVHTHMLDLAEQRAKDAERRVRELETEDAALRAQLRTAEGLHLAMRSQETADRLSAGLDACLSLVEMLAQGKPPAASDRKSVLVGDAREGGTAYEAREAAAAAASRARDEDTAALLQRLQQQAEEAAVRSLARHKQEAAATARLAPSPAKPTPTAGAVRREPEVERPSHAETAQQATGQTEAKDRARAPTETTRVLQPPRSPPRSPRSPRIGQRMAQFEAAEAAPASPTSPQARTPGRLNRSLLQQLDKGFTMTGPQLGQPKEYLQRIRATLANRPDADEDKGSSGSDWGDSGSDSDGDGDSAGAAATRKQHAPMPPVTLPRSAPFLATTDDTAAEAADPSLPKDDLTGATLVKPPSLHASFRRPANAAKRLPSRRRTDKSLEDATNETHESPTTALSPVPDLGAAGVGEQQASVVPRSAEQASVVPHSAEQASLVPHSAEQASLVPHSTEQAAPPAVKSKPALKSKPAVKAKPPPVKPKPKPKPKPTAATATPVATATAD